MKIVKYIILINFFSVLQIGYGQSIGLRGGFELTEHEQMSSAYGYGAYLTLNNFSEKTHLLFSFDYLGRNREFRIKDLKIDYSKYRFSAATLFVKPITENFDFKCGPSISYNIYRSIHQGIISRWAVDYSSNSIGLEVISNFQIKNILQTPISIDFFIIPSYILNIKNNNENVSYGNGPKPEYGNNSFNLTFQLGLSYLIKTTQ